MGLLGKILRTKQPPMVTRTDFETPQGIFRILSWFLDNDPLVRILSAPGPNIIFEEGFTPYSDIPDFRNGLTVNNLGSWFGYKLSEDFRLAGDMTKEQLVDKLDELCAVGRKTVVTAGELAREYNLDFEHFLYERELEKIPRGKEREMFKQNYLSDCVIGAEIRILAWVYHEFFGEWYQTREKRCQ